jgi:NAD(P)-dependent dehydrogenase (short-subunit alcohol dehydrogenase family)
MPKTGSENASVRKAYIVTGPTSGIGRATAFELARHGMLVLVGRDRGRLEEMQKRIEQEGQQAVSAVCDLSDLASVRRAAAEIIALDLPIAGLLNNAGIGQQRATKNALGWDMTFATNHLGPFALTEALVPHLPDGTNVVFVASAVEDPERRPAVAAGFRGGRYISAQASSRGDWKPGGSAKPGMDAYATSKQCNLTTAMAFARETPRLHFNAVEPGFTPGHRPRARRRRLRALSVEIHHSAAGAAADALHQDSKHSETSRRRDHHNPDGYIRPHRRLLRRRRRADARLRARARPEIPGSHRRRDARLAGEDSSIKRVAAATLARSLESCGSPSQNGALPVRQVAPSSGGRPSRLSPSRCLNLPHLWSVDNRQSEARCRS